MLKGQAEKDYQREYMRKLRLKGKMLDPSVRPNVQPKPTFEDVCPDITKAVEAIRAGLIPDKQYDTTPTPFTLGIIGWDADGNPVYEE